MVCNNTKCFDRTGDDCDCLAAPLPAVPARTPPLPAQFEPCSICKLFYCACIDLKEKPVDVPGIEDDEDRNRIAGQRERVATLMSDGAWRTLNEVATICGCSTPSASARLRDFRKEKYGSRTVERRLRVRGVYEYRVV